MNVLRSPWAAGASRPRPTDRSFHLGVWRPRGTQSHGCQDLGDEDPLYTGQKKVALLDVETHDNPIPVESYTMRQGEVWAVICHPGKPFIIINLKGCDN